MNLPLCLPLNTDPGLYVPPPACVACQRCREVQQGIGIGRYQPGAGQIRHSDTCEVVRTSCAELTGKGTVCGRKWVSGCVVGSCGRHPSESFKILKAAAKPRPPRPSAAPIVNRGPSLPSTLKPSLYLPPSACQQCPRCLEVLRGEVYKGINHTPDCKAVRPKCADVSAKTGAVCGEIWASGLVVGSCKNHPSPSFLGALEATKISRQNSKKRKSGEQSGELQASELQASELQASELQASELQASELQAALLQGEPSRVQAALLIGEQERDERERERHMIDERERALINTLLSMNGNFIGSHRTTRDNEGSLPIK